VDFGIRHKKQDDKVEVKASTEKSGSEGRKTLVSLAGVTKSFRGWRALADIDLTVHAGEIVTLIGPNGAGKTTLMRIALGLMKPDSGTVFRAPGLKIGYMPQKFHIDDVLPLNVMRFLTLHPRATPQAIEAVLQETRTEHLVNLPIQRISGGEMQRILLARALIGTPDLLVLDEPVQGVDVGGQGELYGLIEAIREHRGCGVLMVSHDLHMVMAATNRVVCLNHHICCSGSPQAVGQDPSFKALFGVATGSLALYAHSHDHTHNLHGDVVQEEHDHSEGCRHD
jgi:zinc transport system ATP-binding protein